MCVCVFIYILRIFIFNVWILCMAALGLKEVETIADFPEEMEVPYICVCICTGSG